MVFQGLFPQMYVAEAWRSMFIGAEAKNAQIFTSTPHIPLHSMVLYLGITLILHFWLLQIFQSVQAVK